MEIRIQSIHFKAADHLKDYVQEKCDKLDSFFDNIIDGEVFMKLVNNGPEGNKQVEIKINVPKEQLVASEKGSTFEEATDKCTDALKRQIRKYKQKLRSH